MTRSMLVDRIGLTIEHLRASPQQRLPGDAHVEDAPSPDYFGAILAGAPYTSPEILLRML